MTTFNSLVDNHAHLVYRQSLVKMRVWSFSDNFNERHFNGLKSQKNFSIELRIKAMVRGHNPIPSFVFIQNYWINSNLNVQSKIWSNL